MSSPLPLLRIRKHPNCQARLVGQVLPLLRETILENGWESIDFFSATNGKDELLVSDLLHLTDEGYAVMAEAVRATLLTTQ